MRPRWSAESQEPSTHILRSNSPLTSPKAPLLRSGLVLRPLSITSSCRRRYNGMIIQAEPSSAAVELSPCNQHSRTTVVPRPRSVWRCGKVDQHRSRSGCTHDQIHDPIQDAAPRSAESVTRPSTLSDNRTALMFESRAYFLGSAAGVWTGPIACWRLADYRV
jgi:hypothetical protein